MDEQVLTPVTAPADGGLPPVDPHSNGADTQVDDGVEDEALALQRGWVPEEKYHGRQPWIDAKSYNDRYDQVMPVVRKENQRLHSDLAEERRQRQEMQTRLDAMERFQQESASARAEVRIQMLEQERANALQAGDHNEFTRLDRELRKAERESGGAAPVRPATTPNTPAQPASGVAPAQVQAALDDFAVRYPIFNKDERLQLELGAAVTNLQNAYISSRRPVNVPQILELAVKRVIRDNPEDFPNPRSRPAMAESRGAPARSHTGQRTWDNLTAESQETFNGQLARNKSLTREKLLATAPDELFKR